MKITTSHECEYILDLFDANGKQLDRKYAMSKSEMVEAFGEWRDYIKNGDIVKLTIV